MSLYDCEEGSDPEHPVSPGNGIDDPLKAVHPEMFLLTKGGGDQNWRWFLMSCVFNAVSPNIVALRASR